MFSFGCIIVELVTDEKLFESDWAILQFVEKHSKEMNELPYNWPDPNVGTPISRLWWLTARLIAPDPLSRPGSLETERRLQGVHKGDDMVVGWCDKCKFVKIGGACSMCSFWNFAELGPGAMISQDLEVYSDSRRK